MEKMHRRARTSASDDLFHYPNQMELTFQNQPKFSLQEEYLDDSSDSEGETEQKLKRKIKKKNESIVSHSSDSDAEAEPVFKRKLENKIGMNNDCSSGEEGDDCVVVSDSEGDVQNKLKTLKAISQQDQSPCFSSQVSDVVIVDQLSPSEFERKVTVRLRTRDGVERFPMALNETFDKIISELADKQGVSVNRISLSLTDTDGSCQIIKGSDSPSSVNFRFGDIIDCIIISPSNRSIENFEDVVSIKFQGSGAHSVKLFKALKSEPLNNILQQYAQFCQLPLSSLKFTFDGEPIFPTQSPDDLDMDDENVVDVLISK